MFGIGLPEFILIMIVGLIVFGPGKLPEIGRALGKGLREFRKAQATFSAAMNVTESVQPANVAKTAVKAAASAAVAPPSGGAPAGSVAALTASKEAEGGEEAPSAEKAQEKPQAEVPQEEKQEDETTSPSLTIEARPTEVADGYEPPTAASVQKAIEAQQQKPEPRPSVARPFVPEMEPVTTTVKPKKLKKHKKAKKDKKKKK